MRAKTVSKELMKQVYSDLDSYGIIEVYRSGLTANQYNQIDTSFGAVSVSQGDRTDDFTPLTTNGTATAGTMIGQFFKAPEVFNGMSNIHHLSVWGKTDNTTDNLRFMLFAPSSYSSTGTPTFDFTTVDPLLGHLTYCFFTDVTTATELKNATQQYVQVAGTSFSDVNVQQRLSVSLRYASHRTAMTTLNGAVASTGTAITVNNNANAIDNHNNVVGIIPGQDVRAWGEMIVVRKLSTGEEKRYMIGGISGNTITIVPNVYNAVGETVGIAFEDGDEVFFPLTTNNIYCVVAYLSQAGGAPVSTFTLYGRSTYVTYPNIDYVIGAGTGDNNVIYSATGYNNFVVSTGSAGENLFFEVYSTPREWALDGISINAMDNNLLTGTEFEAYRFTNMLREGTALAEHVHGGYNATSIDLEFTKSDRNPKMQWGDFLRIMANMNAATTLSITISAFYPTFFQNNELYVDKNGS